MTSTYIVGIHKSKDSYSLTIRCVDKNPKWIKQNNMMFDATQPESLKYTILFEGNQTQAEQFGHVIRAAYALLNVPTTGSLSVA